MIKEKRPFPVPSEVVMRSALFALANMKTTLQVYNEETGVIVATVSKRLGMQKQDVVVKVRRFEKTAILEIEAPDPKLAQQLLAQISTYVTDGAGRVQADATIQWVDVTRQRESSARRRQLINKARAILPGQSSDETLPAVLDDQERDETLPTVIDSQGSEIVPAADDNGSAPMPIPDNPGVLVKNYQDKVIELKVDPAVFIDRTSYLEVCQACSATVMRGSKYCSSCGRPLTLEAVQPELQNAASKAARASYAGRPDCCGSHVGALLTADCAPAFWDRCHALLLGESGPIYDAGQAGAERPARGSSGAGIWLVGYFPGASGGLVSKSRSFV